MDAVPDKRDPLPATYTVARQNKADADFVGGISFEAAGHTDMLQQILAILRRRKKFILMMTAVAGVLAACVALMTTRTYFAQALLVVDLRGGESGTGRDAGKANLIPQAVQEAALDTHITSLLSEANLRRSLDLLPELTERKYQASGLETAIGNLARRLLHGAQSGPPHSAEVVRLARNLKITQERRSNVISVGYWSPDPIEAAKVANTIAQVYVGDLTVQIRSNAERELTWLTGRIAQVQKDLAQADTDVQLFRQVHAPSDGTGPDEIEQQIIQTARQLSLYKTNAASSRARFEQFSARRKAGGDAKELAEIAGSRRIAELAKRETELTASTRQEDQAELANLRRAIESELGTVEADLQAEVRAADTQVSQNEDKLQLLQRAAHQSVGSQAQLRLLERKAAAFSQLYDDLLRRKEASTENAQTPVPEIRVLANAWPPNRSASISPVFIVPPAMIAFALLGCFIAVLRERLDDALHSARETETALRVPCAGAIPELSSQNGKPIETLLFGRHPFYLRAIRYVLAATLLRERDSGGPKLIVVTSAQTAEGKSTVARSAAIVAAQLPRRVLLIGFDGGSSPPRKPINSKEARPAVVRDDLSARIAAMLSAVKPVPGQGIDYLSVKRDDLFRLLTTDQFCQAIGKFRETYDFVIVDAPSVLEGPETPMLAGWADEVIFLIRWGHTNRGLARRTIERLQDTNSATISLRISAVLTRVPSQGREDAWLETGDARVA